ncbi:MAG: DUF4339 domain-containing protein [Cryobacterium sp.]|nr:DUF4339 domain-containing protein [Oligoflexia bacterium]
MSEKKWFIYVGDHHEGPFSVEEVTEGLGAGRFSRTAFVWSDGMKDWAPLADLPDFNRETPLPVQSEPTFTPVTASPISPILETYSPMAVETGPVLEAREPTSTGLTSIIEIKNLEDATRAEMLRPAELKSTTSSRPSERAAIEKTPFIPKKLKPLVYAIVILFCIVALQKAGALREIENRLGSLLSTLPELPDVAPPEYEELRKAVKTPLSNGPQVSIALSKADPLSPLFYVASNLPDGARFEIYVEGVGHRILNTLSFSGKLDVEMLKHLGKSAALRYPDGKPIPRGEYDIYVMEAPSGQPDLVYKELLQLAPIARTLPNHLPQERRLVLTKRIFFGTKDATYEQRLKEFHDGLVAKAKSELMELSQAAATLESQALVSISTYDRLKRQPIGPKQKQAWNDMNRTWRPIQAQIMQKYAGLSAEQTKENYFHGNLVSEFIVVEKILSDLHSAQEKLFTTNANAAQLEPEVVDSRNQFELRKNRWKSAIERGLASPAHAVTGLPGHVTITEPNAPEAGRSAPAPSAGGKPNG